MADNSDEAFDACREWLGIDRTALGDAMRVLGLPTDESDPLRVLRAAEARLVHLKGLAAGPHHAAREALILRVEQAREAALERIASKPAGASPYAMPPRPRQPIGAAAPVLPGPAETGPGGPADAVALPRFSTRRPVARRRGNGAIVVSGLMVAASLAVFVAFIWWQNRKEEARQLAAAKAAAKAAAAGSAAVVDDVPARPRTKADRTKRTTPPDATVPPSDDVVVSTSRPPRPPVAGKGVAAAAPRRPPDDGPAMDGDDVMAAAEPASGDTGAMPEEAADAGSDTTGAPADVDAMTDSADGPPIDDMAAMESPPDGAAEGDDATTTAEDDATAVDGPVAEALAALHGGDFDLADDVLASALADAVPTPAKRRVADWQVLARCARDFAGFREKALGEVRSGHEYDVNGKKVAVVESDEKRFVYRFQGKNRACDRGKIPAGIVLAIVTEWFDARPANHLFLGAWHATKPEADLERAREHWETAERGGIDASPLVRLLDDPALVAAVPSGDDQTADP